MLKVAVLSNDTTFDRQPFVQIAQLLCAELVVLHDSVGPNHRHIDILFWLIYPFNYGEYNTLKALYPNIVWFTSTLPKMRMGSQRPEPLQPVLTRSDPEEIIVILEWLFPHLFPNSKINKLQE
jgi:hypothetical protein